MPLSFVLSQRGQRQLIYNNYIYSEHGKGKNIVHWRCIYYQSKHCQAKIHTTSNKKCGQVLESNKKNESEHCHIMEKSEIEAYKIKSKIRKMASKTSEKPMNIVAKATSNVSETTSATLPLNKSLCRNIQRERVRVLGGPTLPKSIAELVVPEMFKKTLRGDKFFYCDHNENGNRTLMFTTEENLRILNKCRILQGDGTFETVPEIFKQLYTIHGQYKGNLVPLVYILTTDQSEESYTFVLKYLHKLKPELNPSLLIIDFEISFINAFRTVFPECDIHGCYFHFCQCIWRCIQRSGLQELYQNDENFSLQIRHLLALSFVKPDDVKVYYDLLLKSDYFVQNKDLLSPVLSYFEPNWVIRKKRRHTSPRFSIELWNCYNCVINNDPRTNNGIEGWHNGFSAKLNVAHASIWKFLNAIQLEQSLTENKLTDIAAKKIVNKKSKKAIELDRRLFDIVSEYDQDRLNYLKSIALNVKIAK